MRTALAALVVFCFALSGCTISVGDTGPTTSPSPPRPTAGKPAPTTGTAKLITAQLAKLKVVAVRPKVPGYKRDQFGQTWSDNHTGPGGHNGCDTRNDILASQLTAVQYRPHSKCVVIAGILPADPYTGRRLEFHKTDAAKLQIDHIYPLARAWDMGANKWPVQRRVDFANDEATNLLVVDGPANASKNDTGPGEWLPLNRNYRCTYVLRYLQVATKYALPITTADRNAASAITPTCP